MQNSNKYILFQSYITLFYVINVIVSSLISYNQYLTNENKNPFWSEEKSLTINKINRIIIVCIFILFLYLNYQLYEITKNKKNAKLQIYASWGSVIIGLITLYIVYNTTQETTSDIENPDI